MASKQDKTATDRQQMSGAANGGQEQAVVKRKTKSIAGGQEQSVAS